MKRWIPKVGETVTIKGHDGLPQWQGKVRKVDKKCCQPGTVYLWIDELGPTTASREEIVIHGQ